MNDKTLARVDTMGDSDASRTAGTAPSDSQPSPTPNQVSHWPWPQRDEDGKHWLEDEALDVVRAIKRDYAPDLDGNDGGQILAWLLDLVDDAVNRVRPPAAQVRESRGVCATCGPVDIAWRGHPICGECRGDKVLVDRKRQSANAYPALLQQRNELLEALKASRDELVSLGIALVQRDIPESMLPSTQVLAAVEAAIAKADHP